MTRDLLERLSGHGAVVLVGSVAMTACATGLCDLRGQCVEGPQCTQERSELFQPYVQDVLNGGVGAIVPRALWVHGLGGGQIPRLVPTDSFPAPTPSACPPDNSTFSDPGP